MGYRRKDRSKRGAKRSLFFLFEVIKVTAKVFLGKFWRGLRGIKFPILLLVGAFTFFLVVLVITYFVFWLAGESKLSELLALIHELISPASIAAITFIAGCCIDLNKDGTPDIIEKAVELKERMIR